MNLFILSELRPGFTHVGWSVSYSLEETFAELLNPTFIYPERKQPFRALRQLGFDEERLLPIEGRINNVFQSWYDIRSLPTLPQGTNVLLAIGLTPDFLLSLPALGPLLKKFDLRVGYLLDGFNPEWIDEAIVKYLDHLFVFSDELAEEVAQLHGISTTFLPLGVNTTKSHFPNSNRWIDIISYGRGNETVHKCLQTHFNQQANGRMYFHSTFARGEVDNQQEHVTLMRKLLSRSKISLCFEASHIIRFRGQSPLLYRWFEAWAAGCTVVGKKPFGKGVSKLMDWENSAIDIPDAPSEWINFFNALLDDEETLAQNAERNYRACLLQHDWRYRIKDMLTTLDLPVPEALNHSIAQLQAQAVEASNFFNHFSVTTPMPNVS